tara:strand:+ start:103891 stop:105090 length:1200 start_codon:yes stop_codon:yes gene_type:complete
MKVLNVNIISLLLLILSFTPVSSFAQGENDTFGKTIKEIFIKGSIDDNKLFLVLGLDKGSKVFKNGIKEAIDIERLARIGGDIAEDAGETGRLFYNKEHNGDLVDAVGAGVEFSIDRSKDIIAAPFKSLKKIPGAFSVSMQDAREAYYESENQMGGTLKYAGHAVWASTKVGYYLVIEAPVVAVANMAAAVLGTPIAAGLKLSQIGIKVVLDGAKYTLDLGYHALKGIVNGVAALTSLSYSLVSTTVAVTATTVAAGTVAIFTGVKWILTKPLSLLNPARATIKTEKTSEEFEKVVDSIINMAGESDELRELGVNSGFTKVKGNNVSKTITLFSNSFGKTKKAMTIKVKVKKGKVVISAVMKAKHSRKLYKASDVKEEISKRDFRKEIGQKISSILISL